MKTFRDFLLENEIVTKENIDRLWNEINQVSFEGELTKPRIEIDSDLNHLKNNPKMEGDILGYCDMDPETKGLVLLFSTQISSPKELVEVVAHEMVHQALAEKLGYNGMLRVGHNKEFLLYALDIKKYHNTILKGKTIDGDHV